MVFLDCCKNGRTDFGCEGGPLDSGAGGSLASLPVGGLVSERQAPRLESNLLHVRAETSMAEDSNSANDSVDNSLSERTSRYRQEVEKVVREVGEHPLYELKRSCDLRELEDKIEFIKDIQSICTSKIDSERYLVIGADAKARSFVEIDNLADFDDARVRQQLEKYLQPAPQFEVFVLQSSDGVKFVLFVFPRQRTRRIVAKVSVDHPTEKTQKMLIRKGDLWIKGDSTAKRLAAAEDWDDIYGDAIELETERRTRQRTAHFLERVAAQERLRSTQGIPWVPSSTTDEEFRTLIENICISRDRSRFVILLEALRDDLVEGWHSIDAFGPEDLAAIQSSFTKRVEQVRDHKTNVFLPAMQKLTSAAIYVIKNGGPTELIEMVVQLLEEVYQTTDRLPSLRWLGPRGLLPSTSVEHLSHTIPALETLISLHLIGAYAAKRTRLLYLTPILRTIVREAGREPSRDLTMPLAFWPLSRGWGEPQGLKIRGGRINLCAERVQTDPAFLKLFGAKAAATEALCAYELLLELNSFLAVDSKNTPGSVAFMKKQHPTVTFTFGPDLIAFPLESLSFLSLKLLGAMNRHDQEFLKPVLFDPNLAAFLTADAGATFAKLLRGLDRARDELQMYLRIFSFGTPWPEEISNAINSLGPSEGT